jgi:hypothetical protein
MRTLSAFLALVTVASGLGCSSSTTVPVGTTCRSSRECGGLVCDPATSTCVECLADADCLVPGTACRARACVTLTACTSSRMCPGQVCDVAAGECVDCLLDSDCPSGSRCAAEHVCRAGAIDGGTDGGPTDAGGPDGDAGPADDAGEADAPSAPDGGMSEPDAGGTPDAGPPDAGPPDAGTCTPSPPPTEGTSCASPIDVGLVDDSGQLETVRGNALPEGRDVWYRFRAVDLPDTTCDRFHVRAELVSNPFGAFEILALEGGCGVAPRCTGTGLTEFSFARDFRGDDSTGMVGGECPCSDPMAPMSSGMACTDNSGDYYVRVRRAPSAAPMCAEFELELSNALP